MRGTLGYTTLTVLLVAAPVYFSSGLTARYLHPMLLALALAVLISALIALTLTPALGLILARRPAPAPQTRAKAGMPIVAYYARVVRVAVSLPRVALIAVGLVGVAGLARSRFSPSPRRRASWTATS